MAAPLCNAANLKRSSVLEHQNAGGYDTDKHNTWNQVSQTENNDAGAGPTARLLGQTPLMEYEKSLDNQEDPATNENCKPCDK